MDDTDDDAAPPETRTQTLLREAGVGDDFFDRRLPKGVFSHSQYSAYKRCGHFYERRYVLGQSSPGSGATGLGSAVHSGIERVLKAKMAKEPLPDIKAMRQHVADSFDASTKDAVWGPDDKPGAVKDSAIRVFEVYHLHALPKITPIAIESGFAKKVGDVPVVGWIDLIDEVPVIDVPGMDLIARKAVPQKLVVVDTKTTKTTWGDDKVRKNTQLTLYSDIMGIPDVRIDQLVKAVKGPIYKPSPSIRTAQDAAVLTEDIQETVDAIGKGFFPKTSIDGSWACNEKFCPFWSECRGKKF